jgi:Rod binding domain-containing protein
MTSPANRSPRPERDTALCRAAQELEATFLAEMLKASGLGKARESFGGGAGEDQFSGFLLTEQSRLMVEQGGLGLSESIYRSLAQAGDDGE